nr:M13 family metallopeptidase [Clostridium neonatale]
MINLKRMVKVISFTMAFMTTFTLFSTDAKAANENINNSYINKQGIPYDFEDIIWSKYKPPASSSSNRTRSVLDNGKETSSGYQDDFYGSINNDWINGVNQYITPDLQEISYYTYLTAKSTVDVRDIFNEMLKEQSNYSSDTVEGKMINLYNNMLDTEARNRQGVDGAKKYVDKIKNVNSIDELTELLCTNEMDIFNNLFRFKVSPLYTNKSHQLYIQPTLLGLVNSNDYFSDTEESKERKEKYINYIESTLKLSGYSEDEAKKKTDDLISFEENIAKSMIGMNQLYGGEIDYQSLNVSVTMDELNKMAPNLQLSKVMNGLGIDKSKNTIIVQQKKWLQSLNALYTEENLPQIKNYIEITILQALGKFLDDDFVRLNDEYIAYLNQTESNSTQSAENDAYETIYANFTEALGKLYTDKYCNEEEKRDVELLAKELVSTYRKRINNNDWISDLTKKNALNKLDKLKFNIGYPETYEDYSGVEIKSFAEGGSLVENMMNITEHQRKKEFAELYEPLNDEIFSGTVTPQGVFAEYHFETNSLVVTAGLLEPDFYNINDSKEKKLATVGFVLGHEISHAFDDLGALYDADGNYQNWWNIEDYNKFNEKAEKFKEFYSNIEALPGQFINGESTLGENIADITSMACLLDILETMPNANYKEFFENYAIGYRCARSPEYEQQMLKWDTHSPYKYRVNAVLSQYEKFYETYGIKEGDKMYVKPEDRLKIW